MKVAAILLKNRLQSKKINIQAGAYYDLTDWHVKIIARLKNNLLIQRYSSFFLSVYPFRRTKNTAPGDAAPRGSREKLDEYNI